MEYDRPSPLITIFAPAWTLVAAGLVFIGAVYIYGLPFVNAEGLNGMTTTERRIFFRNIREQFFKMGSLFKKELKASWVGLGKFETVVLKYKEKLERKLGRLSP